MARCRPETCARDAFGEGLVRPAEEALGLISFFRRDRLPGRTTITRRAVTNAVLRCLPNRVI